MQSIGLSSFTLLTSLFAASPHGLILPVTMDATFKDFLMELLAQKGTTFSSTQDIMTSNKLIFLIEEVQASYEDEVFRLNRSKCMVAILPQFHVLSSSQVYKPGRLPCLTPGQFGPNEILSRLGGIIEIPPLPPVQKESQYSPLGSSPMMWYNGSVQIQSRDDIAPETP